MVEAAGKSVDDAIVAIRSLDFVPTSGAKLISNPNKTTTILGRWIRDMEYIKPLMKDVDFNVGTNFGIIKNNNGGFNFLNIPEDLANASKDFFNQYNKPWLEAAITRGDDIVLATKPVEKTKYIDDLGNLQGMYPHELKYLVENNYKPINLTQKEWLEIIKWFN